MRTVWPLAVVAALLGAGRARAQLSPVSPFLPPDGAPAALQSAPNTVEYRGLMSTAHGYLYLLFDPVKKASFWVGLNEPGSPYVVKSDDAEHEKITVRVNGQQLTLPLKEGKVAAGPPALNPGPNGNVVVANAGNLNVVLQPTAADEQRRLQAVADEVRRRRQMREQAAQQPSGGAP